MSGRFVCARFVCGSVTLEAAFSIAMLLPLFLGVNGYARYTFEYQRFVTTADALASSYTRSGALTKPTNLTHVEYFAVILNHALATDPSAPQASVSIACSSPSNPNPGSTACFEAQSRIPQTAQIVAQAPFNGGFWAGFLGTPKLVAMYPLTAMSCSCKAGCGLPNTCANLPCGC